MSLMAALQGCTAALPRMSGTATTADAQALLGQSAAAHGLAALAGIADVNVSYAGTWHTLVGKLQPALVDPGFRGQSEERWLLREGLLAQSHTGPKGRKHVVRHMAHASTDDDESGPESEGDIRVSFNGEISREPDERDAAALVADGYGLFLLGPMLLAGPWAASGRSLVMQRAGVQRLRQDGRDHDCEVLRVRMAPGLGLSGFDQLALYIDRADGLMRRVRFTLNGLESTRGAVAEVDTLDHVTQRGMLWPTRFQERLLRPLPLAVHDWQLTGLDLNRGLAAADIDGFEFLGKAVPSAAPLA